MPHPEAGMGVDVVIDGAAYGDPARPPEMIGATALRVLTAEQATVDGSEVRTVVEAWRQDPVIGQP